MRQGLGNISHDDEFFWVTCTGYNGKCVAPWAQRPGCNLKNGRAWFASGWRRWGSHFPELFWKSLPLLITICNAACLCRLETLSNKAFLACSLAEAIWPRCWACATQAGSISQDTAKFWHCQTTRWIFFNGLESLWLHL